VKQNIFDKTGECKSRGEIAENLFKNLMEKRGYKVIPTTRDQQISNWGDFIININGQDIFYEIKGLKKIGRKDDNINNEFVWIELQKTNGDLGFLYGNFSKIVFQFTNSAFIIVDRLDLVKLVEKNLKNEYVKYSSDALYCLYKRYGRNDLLTLILFKDLLLIPHEFLNP
jgi:hypothetical protein